MTRKQKQTVNKSMRMNSKFSPNNPFYWKGYNDGFEAGKKAAVNHFAEGFRKLQETKGIGDKTILKMIKAMDLPVEEVKE